MNRLECESILRVLVSQAWERDIEWPSIVAWSKNFCGNCTHAEDEELHSLFALTRFMYFGKGLLREMLRSLYREHFRSPIRQRLRRNMHGTTDLNRINRAYEAELRSTRFLGVGNPSESGAHLLYFFRQVNDLEKDLFVDLSDAFQSSGGSRVLVPRENGVRRLVFFDDLVGSASQVSSYLRNRLAEIRAGDPYSRLDVRFVSLFATSKGLQALNDPLMFDGSATCLFELDETYKAFSEDSRYFRGAPTWFDKTMFEQMARSYGADLVPTYPVGYKDGQLMLGFSHNTPDNSLPIFWCDGKTEPWNPAFVRYDKKYKVASP